MSKSQFNPQDISSLAPGIFDPSEPWLSILSQSCSFSLSIFLFIIENLTRNPNITSSHLFRAEIFYDSNGHGDAEELGVSAFTRQMQASYRPRLCQVPAGFKWQRTVVRRFVPRNPKLDQDLVQTVHFLRGLCQNPEETCTNAAADKVERIIILQIPHVDTVEEIPWYHPAVKQLALMYAYPPETVADPGEHNTAVGYSEQSACPDKSAEISVHYCFFHGSIGTIGLREQLSTRLARTAHNLLSTIYRHGTGQLAGYKKRVHHDLIVPQARFQDTYTRLKLTYAKPLISGWQEQTDPGKHVFEDLGIAAFLIELWSEMYSKSKFPGFVDIGCGNGVLVYILNQEGYEGWGFDARRRKSWSTFPTDVRDNLKEMLLVPKMFQEAAGLSSVEPDENHANLERPGRWHDGKFPQDTFIISNHADELTPWTPIVASLNHSSFIAIPCCSHNFSGVKYRAPTTDFSFPDPSFADSSQMDGEGGAAQPSKETNMYPERGKGHSSGSLKQAKGPSAYATLTNWVAKLAVDMGYSPEREMLRIPSTRNAAVLGRQPDESSDVKDSASREDRAREVVARWLGGQQSLEQAGREWVKRASKLQSKTIDAH